MKIAIISSIAERIPPKKYGGTERVVYTLTEELVKKGHDVTLFASGDSETSAKLVAITPVSLREAKAKDVYGFNIPTMLNMGTVYARHEEFDIIHDHNPHMSLPTANLAQTPVVATWHGPFVPELVNYFKTFPKPYRTSISKSQAARAEGLEFIGNVYNGLYMDYYPFGDKPDDYLLYVGRVDMEKGAHIAMDVAARLNKKLVMAAKVDDFVPHIKKYFENYIKPRLKKYGTLIEWVGEVDETQRNELMKNALCLLHPVTWPEPFGLTLIEAQACGCPVIALNQGSIPEVINNGKTGFVVNTRSEMVHAVGQLNTINRADCRIWSLKNFSANNMADGYEGVYEKILENKKRTDNK